MNAIWRSKFGESKLSKLVGNEQLSFAATNSFNIPRKPRQPQAATSADGPGRARAEFGNLNQPIYTRTNNLHAVGAVTLHRNQYDTFARHGCNLRAPTVGR